MDRHCAGPPPYLDNGGRQHAREWIAAQDFVIAFEQDFYHHTEMELIDYAVKTRADSNLRVEEMRQAYVDEYPSPTGSGAVYMVSSDGNHRRLVWVCIGLPYAEVDVQKSAGATWRYYWKENGHQVAKLLS